MANLRVEILDAATARRYGLSGLALRLSRTDGRSDAAPVALRVPTSLLQGMFGADYAARVRWVQFADTGAAPAATGPSAARPVATGTDGSRTTQAAVLSPQVTSNAVMVAAASSPTSSNGTGSFSATSLTPASDWQVSPQTGDFSWSYPMRTPPAPAGPAPSLAVQYDSQTIDGETGSTNNQPSAVGDGWSLSGGGFIERSYTSCSLDDGSSGANAASGDLCWHGDNATLSLAGHAGRLVKDSTTGVWKLQNDDGTRLEKLTGAANGALNGEYWRLTTTDGTQYYFGLNQLPGWSTGKPTTGSTWTVPVYGNDSGEPCHGATFAASGCTQAWRWNLDYVVDPHGNAEALYYTPETNLYAQDGSGGVSYVRGGQIDHIDYGLTSSTVYTANAATDKVLFGYANRCSSTTNCDSAHPATWPDVPWDQNCTAAPCTQVQPTFWSTKMLSTVTTQYWTGSSYAGVDSWALGHSFPDPGDGTSAALWLTSITHTGTVGGSTALPPVVFYGTPMQNRVWTVNGLAPLDKYRITSLTLETGATIAVTYSPQDCQPSEAATIEANANTDTRRCFAQWWTPTTVPPSAPEQDLFHLYVVTQVISDPRTGGGADEAQQTSYVYTGTPGWRYNTSPLTPAKNRTWSVYAGYSSVEVRAGDINTPAAQQTTDYTYFQGLDGDRAATTGGTKTVTVHASDGSAVPDSLWLAGRVREQRTLNGVGGAQLSDTITTAWASAVTANNGTDTARMVDDGDAVTTVPLAAGGTRRTETKTSYDSYGRVTQVDDITPDAGTTCTTTSYATNTTSWLIDYPSEVATVGQDCSVTPTYPRDAISDTRTSYDGQAFAAAPTKGDATTTQIVTGYTGITASTATWQTTATTAYDSLGRPTSVTDPRISPARVTTTAYTPATGGPLTKTVVTNPLTWTTTTSYQPAWGAETSSTDANNHTTTASYDPLGRRTAVWLPDRPQSSNPTSPSTAYAYTVSTSGPLAVATTTLTAKGGTLTSWALSDGLGRPRQTQAPAEGGGTSITDTLYDHAGRTYQTNSAYYTTSVQPSGTLFLPATTVSGEIQTNYDGAGRTTATIQLVDGTEAWRTSYAYPGADRTDTTPPAGSTPTSSWTDSRGHTSKLTQYLDSTPNSAATQEATTYGYDPRGDMTSMTDPAGDHWSWTFDVLGRQTSATDPDTGTTTTSYDVASRVASTTDARNISLAYSYDQLDRKTALYQGSTSGPELASWAYDSLTKGQPTSSTSYVGSVAGTPGTAYTEAVTGYDPDDRPTGNTTTIPTGPLAGNYTTSLSYGADGSLTQQVEPAEGGLPTETLKYDFDTLNNISGIEDTFAGNPTSTLVGSLLYNYLGDIVQTTGRNGTQSFVETSTRADGTDRLTEAVASTGGANTTVADHHYSYDNAGDITENQTTAAGAATDTQCYSYDHLRDLTAAWTPGDGNCTTAPAAANLGGPAPYWTSYTIDPATGNRTSTTETTPAGASTTDTYSYPAAGAAHPHAVTTVTHTTGSTTTTDSYGTPDAAGNTTARPGQTLSYDARGKLASLTKTVGGAQQTNIYDADGNLLLRTDPVSGTNAYLGDSELTVAPGATARTVTRTYSLAGRPIEERDTTAGVSGATAYWLDTDPVNTATIEERTSDGAITRRYTDPYGNARGTTTAWSSPNTYLNAPASSFSGLTQLGARDYDPTTGRFISVDPVLDPTDPQQNNGYSYAHNNPTTESDPTGLRPLGETGDTDNGDWGTIHKSQQTLNQEAARDREWERVNYNAYGGWDAPDNGRRGRHHDWDNGKGYKSSWRWNPVYNVAACGRFGGQSCRKTVPNTPGVSAAAFWCGALGDGLLCHGSNTRGPDHTEGKVFAAVVEGGVGVLLGDPEAGDIGDTEVTVKAASSIPRLRASPNFSDPAQSPGTGWQWRGSGQPGSAKGNWFNPKTDEYLHPDLQHPDPIGPHYDWRAPNGTMYRVYPDGKVLPK